MISSSLIAINVDSDNNHYSSIDGILFNYSQDTLIQCPGGKIYVNILDRVTFIENYAFSGCGGLIAITIPEGVTSIGNYVFRGCSSLTTVTIPDGVTAIGEFAFSDCRSLASVTIGKGVMAVERFAFFYCSGLTSVVLPEGVTDIGERAFSGCFGLTSVVSFAHVPPELGNDCFTGVNTKDCSLIVPCEDKRLIRQAIGLNGLRPITLREVIMPRYLPQSMMERPIRNTASMKVSRVPTLGRLQMQESVTVR